MPNRTDREMTAARAALADTRTPAEVAVDGAVEKLSGLCRPMSETLASIAHDLDVCASSDTLDVAAVCADLAMELRERAKLEAAKEAAAPDLLAACRELLNCADSGRDFAELKRARAAIARAEGGAK